MFPNCPALGAKDETRSIFEHPEVSSGSSSLINWGDGADGLAISVNTPDGFVRRILPSQKIAMAKINVEGWELEVLKGGAELLGQYSVPALCIEYSALHPICGGQHVDIYNLALSTGHKVFKLKDGKSTQSRLMPIKTPAELPLHDNIFCLMDQNIRCLGRALFN